MKLIQAIILFKFRLGLLKRKIGSDTKALEEAKEIFESHGFLIDLWQHGLEVKLFNFVMLSNSKEEQAKSLESLVNDQEWQRKQLDWMINKNMEDL